jgi:membrane protein implicated in regulation of membrane protease activity
MNPNFPAFLPIVHHDIKSDIPLQFQTFCYAFYGGMQIFVIIGSILDCIASIIITASIQTPLVFFGYKVLYLFIVPINFFFLCYFPLYKALKLNLSLDWTFFFIGTGGFIVYGIMSMVGSYGSPIFPGGDTGFLSLSRYFALGQLVAAYSALAIRLFFLLGLLFLIYFYFRAYQICQYERSQINQSPSSQASSPKKAGKEVPVVVVVDKGKVGKVMIANHAFDATQSGDLSLKLGDKVTITRLGLLYELTPS